MSELRIFGLTGIGEIHPRDDLAGIIAAAAANHHGGLEDGDVVVVTQKIVSKAEGQLVAVDPDDPLSHKELVEQETVRVLRRRGDLVISETKHGFVCANAGIDLSNVELGFAALLPEDSDRSARRIRDGIRARAGGFAPDIDDVRALRHELTGVRDRRGRVEEAAAVRKRIGRDVHDTHHERECIVKVMNKR